MSIADLKKRKNESGAAMVTVLMVTLILLVASAGILLESSMHTANVTDAIAEEQAYVAAESGIQTAVNILRGNRDTYVNGNLIDSSKTTTDPINLINYIKALKLSTSNAPGDTSAEPRLSRWIQYHSTYTDRVVVGDSSSYVPLHGTAFKLSLQDPDQTGSLVTYSTVGRIAGSASTYQYPSGATSNYLQMSFTPKSTTTLDIPDFYLPSDLGSFDIQVNGNVTLTDDVRFEIVYHMTDPYDAYRTIRGYLKVPRDSDGDIIPTEISSSSFNGVKLYYSSPTYVILGQTINMTNGTLITNPTGYEVTPVIGTNTVNCNMTPAEPYRLLIKATGYGPRGAKKELEAIIQKNLFNGMTAPATLTLVGSSTDFAFNPGNSTVVTYSGEDLSEDDVIIPPIGTTNDPNLSWVRAQFSTGEAWKANVVGDPANVNEEIPLWLSTPTRLDATIAALRNVAKASGNYYTSDNGPAAPGDYATGTGITFVDGDYTFGGHGDWGGGLLIVTGKLTLKGEFSYKGMIMVTGAEGLAREGGGNGVMQGNVVIAPYDPTNLAQPFLPPKYDMSGGGTSLITYDSNSVANGMTAISNFVLGIAER
jgi:hypothetical protein